LAGVICGARLPRVPRSRIFHGSSFPPRYRLRRGSIRRRLYCFLSAWRRYGNHQRVARVTRFTPGRDQRDVNRVCNLIGLSIFLGAIVGSLSFRVGEIPISLSTSGGTLVAGLIFGWLRSVHPKMHPGILLGACAGARASTAALSVIQDSANSRVPALGFTVCFAVSNTLLTIWGVVMVLLLQ
jgi:uncharacterized transporter YbjL